MGTEIPQFQPDQPAAKSKPVVPILIAGALFLIVCALKWQDVVEYVNGEAKLTEKHQQQLKKKLDELEDAEQYALVAMADGMYPCLHSGRALYFLHAGEVWKYGVTSKGERGRYTSLFLQENAVLYIIQFKGTMTECLQAEQLKLFEYPILPENLIRLEANRLIRPPFNPILK
jgi:hypothetical protein